MVVPDFDRERGEELFEPKFLPPIDMAAVKLREKQQKNGTLEIRGIVKRSKFAFNLHYHLQIWNFHCVNDNSNYYVDSDF